MLQSTQEYGRFWVLIFLSAFLLPLVAQEIHVLLEHHEIQEKCLISEGDEHLHDGSEVEYHCLLCCNKLSELVDSVLTETLSVLPTQKNLLGSFTISHHTFLPFYSIAQRAPPATA